MPNLNFKINFRFFFLFCLSGAGMRSKTNFNPDSLTFAPFVLLPSTFPKSEFEKAVNMQTDLNLLIHKVAHDHEFLSETLSR